MSNGRKLANIILGTEVSITNVDSDLANSISSIKTRLDSDDTKLQSLDTAVKAGFTNLADSDLIVSQLTAKITSVITNLDSDTIALQTVNTKIGLIKSRLDSDDAKLQAISTELSSEISTTNTEISNIKSRLDSDDAKLQLLDTSIQTIKGRLDSDDGAIQTLTSLASVAVGAAGLSDSDLKVVADLRNELDSEILTVRNLALSNINYTYTATADQTTYSGTDNNSLTLAYTAGTIQVFLNGIKLDDADFTATDGTSVNLVEGAQLGHQLTIIVPSVKSNYSSVISINWSGLSQTAKLVKSDDDGGTDDMFGLDCGIDGDYIVGVGTHTQTFAAYVYNKSGSTWSQQAKISRPGGAGQFGRGCAIAGDTIFVSSFNEDVGDTTEGYVYTRSGSTWSLQATLTPGAAHGVSFGNAGACVLDKSNNDSLAIGALGKSGVVGKVYYYQRSGSSWTKAQEIQDSDTSGTGFGSKVDMYGNYMVIGDHGNNAAYVYTRDDSSSKWQREAKLEAGEQAINFGNDVAINDTADTVAVGAYGQFNLAGKVIVFTKNSGEWIKQQTLSNDSEGDYFGIKVALSKDGNNTLVVGSTDEQTGNDTGGKIWVYNRSGNSLAQDSDAWSSPKQITASDVVNKSSVGQSVAISGTSIVAGARGYQVNNGALYVFEV